MRMKTNLVLIWKKMPNEPGTPPDVVIGQPDFNSRAPNGSLGSRRASPESLYFPSDVVVGRMGMFISDSGNHRVLYWREIPTENGQPADLVLGQKFFSDHKANRGGTPTGSTFNDPFGLYLEEDPDEDWDDAELEEGEEGEEERKPKFKLYVADRGNSRVAIWDELPLAPQTEEDEEEDEMLQDDPNALIGEDTVDEDYWDEEEEEEGEGEEGPPKEIPSV